MKKDILSQQLDRYNRLLKKNDDIYRQVSRTLNMPEASLWILYFLRNETVHTQKDLCSLMYQSKQSVNSALKKLELDGFVCLEAAAGDRKKKNIRLTEKGQALAVGTADKIIAAEKAAFGRMSAKEREAYLNLVEKFTAILETEMNRSVKSMQ